MKKNVLMITCFLLNAVAYSADKQLHSPCVIPQKKLDIHAGDSSEHSFEIQSGQTLIRLRKGSVFNCGTAVKAIVLGHNEETLFSKPSSDSILVGEFSLDQKNSLQQSFIRVVTPTVIRKGQKEEDFRYNVTRKIMTNGNMSSSPKYHYQNKAYQGVDAEGHACIDTAKCYGNILSTILAVNEGSDAEIKSIAFSDLGNCVGLPSKKLAFMVICEILQSIRNSNSEHFDLIELYSKEDDDFAEYKESLKKYID